MYKNIIHLNPETIHTVLIQCNIELSHRVLPPWYYVGLAFNIIPKG